MRKKQKVKDMLADLERNISELQKMLEEVRDGKLRIG